MTPPDTPEAGMHAWSETLQCYFDAANLNEMMRLYRVWEDAEAGDDARGAMDDLIREAGQVDVLHAMVLFAREAIRNRALSRQPVSTGGEDGCDDRLAPIAARHAPSVEQTKKIAALIYWGFEAGAADDQELSAKCARIAEQIAALSAIAGKQGEQSEVDDSLVGRARRIFETIHPDARWEIQTQGRRVRWCEIAKRTFDNFPADHPGGWSEHDVRQAIAILGSLNPTWIEWLQGMPSRWTEFTPSETATRRSSSKR